MDGRLKEKKKKREERTFCTPVQKLSAITQEVAGDIGDFLELVGHR